MKTKFLFLLVIFLSGTWLFAQDCEFYYPQTEGKELVYQQYDKKGKPDGKVTQKVVKYNKTGNGAEATIQVNMTDNKGELVSENELDVRCEAGIFYFDMESYINQEMMSAYEDMEVKVDASTLEMPSNLSVGQKLDDGDITIEVYSGGMKIMTMVTTVKDRKVEAKEDLTTPAGTFTAYKITQTTDVKTIMSMSFNSVEWLSPGVGMIKSESYSSSGKLMSTSELIAIN